MKDNIIETSIDELIRVLKEKKKMGISEVASFLNVTQRQLEPWLNILEDNGIIEIKYPVIGEPKIVLKPTVPEKIDIKKVEKKPEIEKVEKPIVETPSIKEKVEIKPEMKSKETKALIEKVEKLENKVTEISREVNISTLKEELTEILLIIAGLRDIEKISFYLKEVLSIIHEMKEKGIWTKEDKELIITMLKGIAEDWRKHGEEKIAKLFYEVKDKVVNA